MEQIFSFSKIAQNAMKHRCPKCGGPTVGMFTSPILFLMGADGPISSKPCEIRQCLDEGCDTWMDPAMPEVRP